MIRLITVLRPQVSMAQSCRFLWPIPVKVMTGLITVLRPQVSMAILAGFCDPSLSKLWPWVSPPKSLQPPLQDLAGSVDQGFLEPSLVYSTQATHDHGFLHFKSLQLNPGPLQDLAGSVDQGFLEPSSYMTMGFWQPTSVIRYDHSLAIFWDLFSQETTQPR